MSEKQLSALIELLLRKDAEIAELKAEREKIVRCAECASWETNACPLGMLADEDGFCSFGQRKEAEE